ncbi:hypothetical protein DFJ73DRAFT_820339 [Zopfochytrium polystomum]|nr:hypothetical protein DFJ73DRAFT_820339 [Zopfochytrium polystomum]
MGGYDARGASNRAGGGFEKSLAEIQKLLERAKNGEAPIDPEISMFAAAEADRERKKKAGAGAGGQASTPLQAGGGARQAGPMGMLQQQKQQIGRKPLRLIALDLAKRIDQLKTNQAEWESFQARIAEYRQMETQTDIIRHNRDVLANYLPEIRKARLSSAHESHENHRALVLKKKRKLDATRLKVKIEAVQKKDSAISQKKEEVSRAQLMQKKWFIVVTAFARMLQIKRTVEEAQEAKAHLRLINHAARVIQKGWRQYRDRKLEEAKQQSLATIASVFVPFVRHRRSRMKHNSADTIRQFFKEVHDTSKLMKVVKKYRFSVIKAQGICRAFLSIRSAQLQLITLLWDRLEHSWWTQRKLAHDKGGGSTASLDEKATKAAARAKPQKKGKKAKDDEKQSERSAVVKIPETIKVKVLKEDLILRKRKHRAQLQAYADQLQKWNAENKRMQPKMLLLNTLRSAKGVDAKPDPEDDTAKLNMPRKPHFKVLPSPTEMHELMERGFMMAATSRG